MYKRNLLMLATCQGLMLSCTSLTIATSALVGVMLAPTPAMATLPLGLAYLSTMMTVIPASFFMKHFGRRAGFALGGTIGMLGGTISATGIYHGNFVLFCTGSALFGMAAGFSHFYRFAAAEIVDESYKSRAISWVLAGGLVAAFVGPNAAGMTREMIPQALFSASCAFIALFCAGIIVMQLFIRIPMPTIEESQSVRRPLGFVLTRPIFLVAVLCAMIAYGTMNLLMTATPLAMDHRHMAFSDTALVIQWHIVGMFAPSFFTGNLINRFGVLRIMFVGALALISCALIALVGQMYMHFLVGLVLLGVGWNFLYIGATTLLTEVYQPQEKALIQGINEFMVFSATAFTAMASGYLHHTLGWESLNRYTLPVICFAAAIITLLGWQLRQQRAQAA